MNLSQETRDTLHLAASTLSTDTPQTARLRQLLLLTAQSPTPQLVDELTLAAEPVRRSLMADASLDAWIPADWNGDIDELESIMAFIAQREQQATLIKKAVEQAARQRDLAHS